MVTALPRGPTLAEAFPWARVVLSYGMGRDSTAILLRWLQDPSSRPFELADLVVLSAQVGHEFADTKRLVEAHVYPRLRAHRVRTVQVARAGPSQPDGIVVLSDTRQPSVCHSEGAYTLGQELASAGTVPTYSSGKRLCTLHAKAWPLDTWIAREMGDTRYLHILGFNADELRRVAKDTSYCTQQRHTRYPLVEWGWGHAEVAAYDEAVTGEAWAKSCCTFCTFAGCKAPMMARYRAFPEAAAEAVFLEAVSTALNPRMTLYSGGRTVRESLEADGNAEALALADRRLEACEWALYDVRRIYFGKGCAHRKVEALDRGSRAEMLGQLHARSIDLCTDVEWSVGSPRVYVRRRADGYPTLEHFLVPAPGVVEDKCRPSFDGRWCELVQRQ